MRSTLDDSDHIVYCGLCIFTFVGIALNNEQNNELVRLTGVINNIPKCMKELESIVAEAECHAPGTGVTLQEVWDDDTGDRQQFFHDQVHNKTGSKGNKRSLVTYHIGKHCMQSHTHMHVYNFYIKIIYI